MAVIKKIAIYNGENWDTDDIGANASNIEFYNSASSATFQIAGSSNVQGALNNTFTDKALTSNSLVITNAQGKLISSNAVSIGDLGTISTKVNKTGDTITGVLSAKFSTFDLSKTNNGVTSTLHPTTFNILDTGGRISTRIEGVVSKDGNMASYWYVRNYNTSGGQVAQKGIQMIMNKSGALTYTIADETNFRNALGASSGVWPTSLIPNLNANKITAGTFDDARIPNLNANKITAGTFDAARIPNLNANKITAGTLPIARGGTGKTDGFAWKYLTKCTGTNTATFDLTNYSEVLIAAKFSSKLVTAVIPKGLLTTSNQEVWISGGKSGNTTDAASGALRAVCNITTTKLTGVASNNGGTDTISGTTFYVYVR